MSLYIGIKRKWPEAKFYFYLRIDKQERTHILNKVNITEIKSQFKLNHNKLHNMRKAE